MKTLEELLAIFRDRGLSEDTINRLTTREVVVAVFRMRRGGKAGWYPR